VRPSDEASHVCAYEWHARKTERLKHRYAQLKRVPRACVIARPHGRVSLVARVSRASDDVGPLVRLDAFKPFASRASHQQREHVAVLRVSRTLALVVIDNVHLRLA